MGEGSSSMREMSVCCDARGLSECLLVLLSILALTTPGSLFCTLLVSFFVVSIGSVGGLFDWGGCRDRASLYVFCRTDNWSLLRVPGINSTSRRSRSGDGTVGEAQQKKGTGMDDRGVSSNSRTQSGPATARAVADPTATLAADKSGALELRASIVTSHSRTSIHHYLRTEVRNLTMPPVCILLPCYATVPENRPGLLIARFDLLCSATRPCPPRRRRRPATPKSPFTARSAPRATPG